MRSDQFKMSASYEPAIATTSSMNYCFYFPFSFGKESLKEVYEQVNVLNSLYSSLPEPVHAATDLNLD